MDLRTCLFSLVSFYLAESYDLDTHPNWKYISKNCGKSKETQFRIYGGQEAALGQFPWLVRVKGEANGYQGFVCGGAVIGPRHVITAAHCQEDAKIISVRLGEYDTSTPVDCDDYGCAKYQDIDVKFFKKHPLWNTSNFHNDVAVIKLVKDVEFNDYVQPLCLPGRNQFFEKYNPKGDVNLAGWGYADIANTKKIPKVLRFVSLKVRGMSDCTKTFSKFSSSLSVKDQLCIGLPNGKDTCEGDSGGPVMQEIKVDDEYRFYCLGVVSFGSAVCGSAPAVYTHIRSYLNWILDNL